MADTTGDMDDHYGFECIQNNMDQWETSEMKLKFMQWNLDQHGCTKRFRVRGKFDVADEETFLRSFLESPQVRAEIPFPHTMPHSMPSLTFRRLKTSVTSMSFFEKIEECSEIVSKSGHIRKCFDEVIDDCNVNDCLRDMLVNPESEYACNLTKSEEEEGIFHIFKRLVIGGAMCQPDDTITEYTAVTKEVYKALLSVRKMPGSKEVSVYSPLYLIVDDEASNQSCIFPKKSRFNACFISVDPRKQSVMCWYAPFVPFW